MPKKKKPLRESTKEELAERFFPNKKLRDKLNKIAHERDNEGPNRRLQS